MCTVERLRECIELDRDGDGRNDIGGQQPFHRRHDAREIRVALREIRSAVKIGLEELHGRRITRRAFEIRIGHVQPPRLPLAQPCERLRERRILCAFAMMLLHARQFAQQ